MIKSKNQINKSQIQKIIKKMKIPLVKIKVDNMMLGQFNKRVKIVL